jgi:hypothetical protein
MEEARADGGDRYESDRCAICCYKTDKWRHLPIEMAGGLHGFSCEITWDASIKLMGEINN